MSGESTSELFQEVKADQLSFWARKISSGPIKYLHHAYKRQGANCHVVNGKRVEFYHDPKLKRLELA